ncbi:hypothetical protein [Edaphobacter modestus]|uniref:hypothetical protein n=1 Tax=Edaphobacter modestus TaxID=388466 RepID=UPI0030FE3D56
MPTGVQINAPMTPAFTNLLSPATIDFFTQLQRRFGERRKKLLAARIARQRKLDAGEKPDFLPETRHVRKENWRCAHFQGISTTAVSKSQVLSIGR